MGRLSIKGMLFGNLDGHYKYYLEKLFDAFPGSTSDFEKFLIDEQKKIEKGFDKVMLEAHRQAFTHRTSFYVQGILTVEKAMFRNYRKSFRLYFSYLSTCHHLLDNTLKEITGRQNVTGSEGICLGLFAHLLRVGDQIGLQLLNGYSDSALILWRSFYEHALVLKFLAEQNDEELTVRFMQHNSLQGKKLLQSYNQRLVAEGFERFDDQTEMEVKDKEADLIKSYGKEFTEEYGWSNAKLRNGKRVTLRDLETFVHMGRYRPFYIWASGFTHGTFEAFKRVLQDDKIDIRKITDIAYDEEGLIDPMQITLAVLLDATEPLVQLLSDEAEAEINLRLLHDLYDQLRRHFAALIKKQKREENSKPLNI
jgi:hypothetical protein